MQVPQVDMPFSIRNAQRMQRGTSTANCCTQSMHTRRVPQPRQTAHKLGKRPATAAVEA